ncbi:MAG: glutamyl-tRNA reductase [Anaerolineae bacterium]|nr:glutamyl-tRNA reductase [Anaerolineae bacterium]
MSLFCLGLNHNTANLDLRERLAFTDDQVQTFLTRSTRSQNGHGSSSPAWEEMVMLSTCNRVEIYCVSPTLTIDILEQQLADFKGLDRADLHPFLYQFNDEQVVGHLFRVAAGLDSMVIGEPQILGQVTGAYTAAQAHGTSGKTLSRLFQTAIYTGKRVRTETAIGQNSISVSTLAARLISQRLDDLAAANIVLLGAGEMAELAIEALRKRGVTNIHIVSRTMASACQLAERWQGETSTLDSLPAALRQADALITSTSAPHTILNADMMASIVQSRPPGRPLIIVDIAVPRDVDPQVGELPNIHLFDLDTLNVEVSRSLESRQKEIPSAEAIILHEYTAFIDYLAADQVIPIIRRIRDKAHDIRQSELEKALRRIPDLDPQTQEQVALLTRSIVNKILHNPTARLRQASAGPQVDTYAQVAQALFGVEDLPAADDSNGS